MDYKIVSLCTLHVQHNLNPDVAEYQSCTAASHLQQLCGHQTRMASCGVNSLHNFTVGKPEDVAFCGALEYYDKVYDRVTPKVDRPLKRTNKVFKSVTTSDDPVIRCARAIIDLRHTPMQTPMQKHVFVLRCCLDQIYTVQRPFLYKSDIFVSQTAVDHTWRTCHCQLVPSHLECNMLSSLQQHCDA